VEAGLEVEEKSIVPLDLIYERSASLVEHLQKFSGSLLGVSSTCLR
jgi:hypothetical protein